MCKLVFWNRNPNPTDPSLDNWPAVICTQIIQCLSICSACFLYLKPLLDSVESGFIRSDDIRRRGSDYIFDGASTRKIPFSIDSVGRGKGDATKMKSLNKPHYAADVEGGNTAHTEDEDSLHSQTRIIKETRTFAVDTVLDVRDASRQPSQDAD